MPGMNFSFAIPKFSELLFKWGDGWLRAGGHEAKATWGT
jgi:hypothetical protein